MASVSCKTLWPPNGLIYNMLFVLLIVFFCFFYTEVVLTPQKYQTISKNPEALFREFVQVTTRQSIFKKCDLLTVGGAIYLSTICICRGCWQTICVFLFFGGTSLLILVGVQLTQCSRSSPTFYLKSMKVFLRNPCPKSKSALLNLGLWLYSKGS